MEHERTWMHQSKPWQGFAGMMARENYASSMNGWEKSVSPKESTEYAFSLK